LACACAWATAPPAHATAPYTPTPFALTTPWTRAVSTVAPLPEYPRPQLARRDWMNLNGRWQFEAARARQRPPFGQNLAETVLVPYPVQSPLSGIERQVTAGWYRRTFTVPAQWADERVLLNFGAVSWAASVYVNGRLAGTHHGDYDAFSVDITKLLRPKALNELVVGYFDPIGFAGEPVGKQVPGVPSGFYHTASSGIWQTVWLEPVAAEHVTDLALTPQVPRDRLLVDATTTGSGQQTRRSHQTMNVQALAGNHVVASATGPAGRPLSLSIPHPRLWSPSDPYLYGLRMELVDRGRVADQVTSYFGMRSISLGQGGGFTRLLLNGHFLFQSGALAQGYWPDGVYTAPTDAALRYDLQVAKQLGFNMLREHVKVEPARWYYWAAKLGMLVWQDMPNMPVDAPRPPSATQRSEFRRELSAIVVQHRSEPAIVTWVPFNEGWEQFDVDGVTEEVRKLDPSRVIDSQSGSANCCDALESAHSDIRDAHLYTGPFTPATDRRASVIGEYGGVLAFPPPADRWPGIATSIGSPAVPWPVDWIEGVLRRQFASLALEMRAQGLSAAVFTELAAYEQELGIVSYDRRVSTLPVDLVRNLNRRLIEASTRVDDWIASAVVPPGTSGLWQFDEGRGALAADASGREHPLKLYAGAGWTRGVAGSALAIHRAGQLAAAMGPVLDTTRSFTVSAWLKAARAHESGSAISQLASDGTGFSLGIATVGASLQARPGLLASGHPLPAHRTWWTFLVPDHAGCPAPGCGVRANMHYDDGRDNAQTGRWYHVVGVYDDTTSTVSIYVDGVAEDVEHVTAPPAARGPLLVGAGLADYTPTDAFLGSIDELRVYSRALTAAEVWELYRAEHGAGDPPTSLETGPAS
jgi:Concanavalin A-like lectin/glucanases superfamily/Glycosyl hydrolases family 2, sugar binding domain/Glycosyl hydrolases family 2